MHRYIVGALLLLSFAGCGGDPDACLEDACEDEPELASIEQAVLPPPPPFFFNVDLWKNGSGGTATASSSNILANCTGEGCTVLIGSTVTLVATPAPGYIFAGWGGCSNSTQTTLVLSAVAANTSCSAYFLQVRSDQVVLWFFASPPEFGTVNGKYGCAGSACAVYRNQSVSLSASAKSGHRFVRWSGCSPTPPPPVPGSQQQDLTRPSLTIRAVAQTCIANFQ